MDSTAINAKAVRTPEETRRVLDAALEYARHGWALIPIGPDKRPHFDLLPKDKSGRPTWKPLRVRRATDAQMRKWFEIEPNCNIALICGQVSGGMVVVDFDDQPPAGLPLPLSPRSLTARGEHFFLRSQVPVRTELIGDGGRRIGEIRGGDGYVVVPPSTHPSGHIYAWAGCLSPSDLLWQFADYQEWRGDCLASGHDLSAISTSRDIPTSALLS